MAEIGLRSKMLVKDVMSSPVITVTRNASANKVAELMDKNGLGCIVVTNPDGKPEGIITERDLVVRVLAKNTKPDSLKAEDVMTSPLTTIMPDATINDAARKMSKMNIRRLGVLYKGQVAGIISSRDILAVMPELCEIMQEKAIIESENQALDAEEKIEHLSGYCDNCERWSEDLHEVNGTLLCEDCRADLGMER